MSDQPTPVAGMPATIHIGSDSYAARVVSVASPTRIFIAESRDDEKGSMWSKRKDGRWRPKGAGRNSGYSLGLGYAKDYRDPSF